MSRKKKAIIAVSITLSIIILIIAAFLIRDASLCTADYKGGKLEFDNHIYEEISYTEIAPYKETWKIVCKTKDKDWTIYEIEQYPNHEYVVARTAWEGRVLKLIQ